jgi:APA family basic amino acid/polyamine antiporter
VGVAFSKFAAYVVPTSLVPYVSEDNKIFSTMIGTYHFTISSAQCVSIVLIILLTSINTRGVKTGKLIQNTFTITKLASLFGLIIFGFIMIKGDVWNANWTNAWEIHKLNPDNSVASYTMAAALGAIAASMVGSIFSSDAWNNVTFIAGEMKNPQREVALSLFFGTMIVTIIYVSANLVYTGVLSLHDIASADKDRVAVCCIAGDIW